ncbi:cullin-4A [Trichonephila clavipes]|uniref:Cullin-4A n=1 Tax=Trichonephila clavipes TaxID=2585209 RepID=A0A8X6W3H7_TRICX|nr:cullin-4A [Trichonephila clavipes]
MHYHTGPAPVIMVWGGIGYYSRTPLVRIVGTLNSQRYISEVLEPVVLPYLQGLATAIFQQDNAQPHVRPSCEPAYPLRPSNQKSFPPYFTLGLGSYPGKYMDVCKCIVPSWHGDTLNSRLAANPLVRLVEGEERWEAPDHPQGVLPQNWGETEQNHSVTCMVLKATANDRRH